jgi:hypothetical protein
MGKWTKFGDIDIYESIDGLIVRTSKGWSVWGDKKGVRGNNIKVYPSGRVWYDQTHLYAGEYKTKEKALEILNKMESSYKLKGVRVIEVDDKDIDNGFSTLRGKKGGGFLLIKKDDEIGKAHEMGHIKAGHHIKNLGRETNYNREIEAVNFQIEDLEDKGIYNGLARNRIVRNLADYDFRKSKNIKKSRIRAKKDIRKIEARLGIT